MSKDPKKGDRTIPIDITLDHTIQFELLTNEEIRGTKPINAKEQMDIVANSTVEKFSEVTPRDIQLFFEHFFPRLYEKPTFTSLQNPRFVNLEEENPGWMIASIYYRINPPDNRGTVESFIVPLVGHMLDVGPGILNIRQALKIGSDLVSYVDEMDSLEAQIHTDGVVKVWNKPYCYLLGQHDKNTAAYGRKPIPRDKIQTDGTRYVVKNFKYNTIYFFSDTLLNIFLAPTDNLKLYLQNFLSFMESPRLNGDDNTQTLVSLGTRIAELEYLIAKKYGIEPEEETNRLLLMYRNI